MRPLGRAFERLVDATTAAYGVEDPDEAILFMKAIGKGAPLVEIVQPTRRAETEPLVSAVAARASVRFGEWCADHGAPDAEVDRVIELIDQADAKHMAEIARGLVPAETPVQTVWNAWKAVALCEPVFYEDIVARDMGMALGRSALRAGEDYKVALWGLELTLKK